MSGPDYTSSSDSDTEEDHELTLNRKLKHFKKDYPADWNSVESFSDKGARVLLKTFLLEDMKTQPQNSKGSGTRSTSVSLKSLVRFRNKVAMQRIFG
ncbi:MAG: hypothetical protein ACTSUE_05025 [Promethearchaeota archaeon]